MSHAAGGIFKPLHIGLTAVNPAGFLGWVTSTRRSRQTIQQLEHGNEHNAKNRSSPGVNFSLKCSRRSLKISGSLVNSAAPRKSCFASRKSSASKALVAKRLNSVYESARRSGAWVKYKITKSQEFVIDGYTLPEGSRSHFG
jgi:hypothetical protein